MWELDNDPDAVALRIMPLRAFARAIDLVKSAKSDDQLPKGSAMVDLAKTLIFDDKERRYREQKAAAAARTAERRKKRGQHT